MCDYYGSSKVKWSHFGISNIAYGSSFWVTCMVQASEDHVTLTWCFWASLRCPRVLCFVLLSYVRRTVPYFTIIVGFHIACTTAWMKHAMSINVKLTILLNYRTLSVAGVRQLIKLTLIAFCHISKVLWVYALLIFFLSRNRSYELASFPIQEMFS